METANKESYMERDAAASCKALNTIWFLNTSRETFAIHKSHKKPFEKCSTLVFVKHTTVCKESSGRWDALYLSVILHSAITLSIVY